MFDYISKLCAVRNNSKIVTDRWLIYHNLQFYCDNKSNNYNCIKFYYNFLQSKHNSIVYIPIYI